MIQVFINFDSEVVTGKFPNSTYLGLNFCCTTNSRTLKVRLIVVLLKVRLIFSKKIKIVARSKVPLLVALLHVRLLVVQQKFRPIVMPTGVYIFKTDFTGLEYQKLIIIHQINKFVTFSYHNIQKYGKLVCGTRFIFESFFQNPIQDPKLLSAVASKTLLPELFGPVLLRALWSK